MWNKIKYLRSRLLYYRHAPLLLFAGRIVLFVLGGVGIGLFSAWYMIGHGSALTTVSIGPWRHWSGSGLVDTDPYTLANMARSGRLAVTSSNTHYYTAHEDSDGDDLTSDCDYLISGKPLDTDWWSFAVYRDNGRPIRNHSRRTGFNSTNILRHANGAYDVHLAAQARPGNWIETGDRGELVLMLRLYGIRASKDTQRSTAIEQNLPVIRKVACR